jgi:peptidoglycan/LPS O-acetylase OafA/YrhL
MPRRFRQDSRKILLAVRVSTRAAAFVEVMSGASGRRTKENAMSLTTATATVTRAYAARPASSLRRTTVVAGLVAAAVTTGVAAAVHAAGVSFEVDGEVIPLAGFAQTTFLGAVIGGVVLAVLNRRSRSARRRFLQMAVALTALSCVPSVTWPDDAATKLALVALHVLAAAIVVPALVRHAQD